MLVVSCGNSRSLIIACKTAFIKYKYCETVRIQDFASLNLKNVLHLQLNLCMYRYYPKSQWSYFLNLINITKWNYWFLAVDRERYIPNLNLY